MVHHIRDYRDGRDLADWPRGIKVIDLLGRTAEQVRERFPSVYQRLLERVKPKLDVNCMDSVRERWWLHRRLRENLRTMLTSLPRYIATVETAKHRTFQFLGASILPENMLIAFGSDVAFHFGVLGLSPGLSSDALLTQLVALNAQRAAEEKTGQIRWLRPEFQNPAARKSLLNQELLAPVVTGQQADLALNSATQASLDAPATLQPWPNTLPEQVRALAQILASSTSSLALPQIEARFKGKGPWKRVCPPPWKRWRRWKRWAGHGARGGLRAKTS